MRGQHERHVATAHRFDQRQDVAAGDAETAIDARLLQNPYDEVRVVHEAFLLPPIAYCSHKESRNDRGQG